MFHGRPAIESKLTNGKTQTGNDEKRFRDFQLTISQDGESLVGTNIDLSDINNREKRLDVIWNRVKD